MYPGGIADDSFVYPTVEYISRTTLAAAIYLTATTMEIDQDARLLHSHPLIGGGIQDIPITQGTPTPAFLYTGGGALEINGRIPKDAIIDTGASKVFISTGFALYMGVSLDNLGAGENFITASGSMEQPLGVTTVIFTLMKREEYQH